PYTHGLCISDLHRVAPDGFWSGAFDLIGSITPIFTPGGTRQHALFLGQSIFTPKNLQLRPPDPRDRPYAGWLYVGASLLQETNKRMLENLELQLGVVGPMALGEETQNGFHDLIGQNRASGWSTQLQNEPGIALSYERTLPLQ